MKIVTNRSVTSFGGIERIIDDLVDSKPKGTTFSYVSKSNQDIDSIGSFRNSRSYKVRNGYVGTWANQNEGYVFQNPDKYILGLIRFLENDKPDIALVNGTNDLAYLFAYACSICDIPFISAVHGYLFKEVGVENTDSEEYILSHANHVVHVSDFSAQIGRDILDRGERDSVIYNGLHPEFISNQEKKNESGIGWVGRNSVIKNLDLLVDIANLSDLKFDIILSSKPDFDLPNNINIHTPKDSLNFLKNFYSERELVLSTSRFETYGNVPIESIVAGTPAIVPDHMGVCGVLNEVGLGDLVLRDYTAKGYLNKIEEIRGLKIPVNLRKRIGSLLHPKRMSKQYFSLLEGYAKSGSQRELTYGSFGHRQINFGFN